MAVLSFFLCITGIMNWWGVFSRLCLFALLLFSLLNEWRRTLSFYLWQYDWVLIFSGGVLVRRRDWMSGWGWCWLLLDGTFQRLRCIVVEDHEDVLVEVLDHFCSDVSIHRRVIRCFLFWRFFALIFLSLFSSSKLGRWWRIHSLFWFFLILWRNFAKDLALVL